MAQINIKQLAEQLNLSAATISRALHDSHEISAETKEKVWALAKELNYQPNPFASSLRQNKSKTIAVILPKIDDNFFAQAINGIEEVARDKGFHVLIYLTHESAEREAAFIETLSTGRVDGILISLSSGNKSFEHLKKLMQNGLPVVFFDRVFDQNEINVTTNDYESGFAATAHLIDCGCSRIAYLMALGNLAAGKQRLQGYCDALKEHSVTYDSSLIFDYGKSTENSLSYLTDFISRQKPDGVVSSIEQLGKLSYQACRELKLVIPNDIKIVSFSNLDTASLLSPSLTTIEQPAFDMGKEAAGILFRTLKNSNYIAESKVLPSILVKRDSTINPG